MADKVKVIKLQDDSEYQPLLTGVPETQGMRSGRVYLLPDQECGEHTTGDHEEMLVFLAGKGHAIVDRTEQIPVGQGSVSYVPPHTVHNIKNTSQQPLVYIYCVAPIANIGD